MKTQEEIEQLAKKEYGDNLHNPFFTAAPMGYIKGYTQCQKDMQEEVEYWQGESDHWHQQAMDMTDKTFTKEELIQCMIKSTRWDTFKENEPEYKMDMDEFFDYIIKQIRK
jgi:hypothetical protein